MAYKYQLVLKCFVLFFLIKKVPKKSRKSNASPHKALARPLDFRTHAFLNLANCLKINLHQLYYFEKPDQFNVGQAFLLEFLSFSKFSKNTNQRQISFLFQSKIFILSLKSAFYPRNFERLSWQNNFEP